MNAGGEQPDGPRVDRPNPCGPFAALEGHGAGQADRRRRRAPTSARPATTTAPTDRRPRTVATASTTTATPHGGRRAVHGHAPVDLSGTPDVSAEQQAFAENLVTDTLERLPQWSDPAVAEAAGFRSIGDGATGHEHYIQWDWIDDDVLLDPDHPESLVYEPQPDGSRGWCRRCTCSRSRDTLDDVPDWGGALMQWHIHDNLCFTADPGRSAASAASPTPTARAPRRSSSSARSR